MKPWIVTKPYSTQSILDLLAARGLLQQRPQAEAFILTSQNKRLLPVHRHLYLGILAALATLSVILVLWQIITIILAFYLSNNYYNNYYLALDYSPFLFAMCGPLLMMLSFWPLNKMKTTTTWKHSFYMQSALMLMITGKIATLLLFYLLHINLTLAVLVVMLPPLFFFTLPLDRFITFYTILLSLFIIDPYLFILFLTAIVILLFLWKNCTFEMTLFAYACIFMLATASFLMNAWDPVFAVLQLAISFVLIILGYKQYENMLIFLGTALIGLQLLLITYHFPFSINHITTLLIGVGAIFLVINYLSHFEKWDGN